MLKKLKAGLLWLFNHTGDPRVKNTLIAILVVLTMFGVIAPDTATGLRDGVLSLAL